MPGANGFLGGLPQADGITLDYIDHADVDVMVHAADVFTVRTLHFHVFFDLRSIDNGDLLP